MSAATSRQQRWSQAAFARVSKRKPEQTQAGPGEKARSEYRSLCMKMPTLLKQSGLVQALAFMRSRSDSDSSMSRTYCRELAEVYYAQPEETGTNSSTKAEDCGLTLLRQAQGADLMSYLVMTRDLIDISVWFRRFAQSELPAPLSGSGDL